MLSLISFALQSGANIEKELQIDTVFSSVETTIQTLQKVHNKVIMCKSRECLCSNERRRQQGKKPVICNQPETIKDLQIKHHGDIYAYCNPCFGINQDSLTVSLNHLTNRNIPTLKEKIKKLTTSYNSLKQNLDRCNADLNALKTQ